MSDAVVMQFIEWELCREQERPC